MPWFGSCVAVASSLSLCRLPDQLDAPLSLLRVFTQTQVPVACRTRLADLLTDLQAERKEKQEKDLRKLPGCTAEQSPEELLDKIHKVSYLLHNLLFTLIFLLCKISKNRRSYQISGLCPAHHTQPAACGEGVGGASCLFQ